MKISIIIPVYNEEKTIGKILNLVEKSDLPLEKEILIVDDGSGDKTREILKGYEQKHRVIYLDKNYGKGRAIREGIKSASGELMLIQDADLEYDPKNYPNLIQPILDGDADVVYGSRFMTHYPHRALYNHHYLANRFLTYLSNFFTNLNISDMETGYKVFTKKAAKEILPCLKSNRFGIEAELTAQIAKHKFRVYEVGISYRGRTYNEGKKINWKDGLAAVWHIIRFNLLTRR